MSQWTHVTGLIRIDSVRHLMSSSPDADVKRILIGRLGTTFQYDDPQEKWQASTVPAGSEGSIQYHILKTKVIGENGLPWGCVALEGDLRGYGGYEDVMKIFDWLVKALKNSFPDSLMVRDIAVAIAVEGGKKYVVTLYDETTLAIYDVDRPDPEKTGSLEA